MDEITALLGELVAIDSTNPEYSGNTSGEKEIGDYIYDYFKRSGIECERQDVTGPRSNIIARVHGNQGNKDKKALLLCSHMDTVFIEGMTFIPLVREERLYGPGACDAKGSLASMMHALRMISDVKKRDRDIWFLAVVSEEIYHLGITRFLKDFRSFDACVIGEPSRLDIGTAHKGFVRLRIRTYGKSAHGATPELGINAIYTMNEIISELKDVLIPSLGNIKHGSLGSPTINLGKIDGGVSFNLVPDSCIILIDRRTLPGEDPEEVLDTFRESVNNITRKDQGLKAEVLDDVQTSPWLETGKNEKIVQAAEKAVSAVKGSKRCFGFPYVTDGGLVSRQGVPTIILGPGDAANCHILEEYVDIRELKQAAEIYKNIYLNY